MLSEPIFKQAMTVTGGPQILGRPEQLQVMLDNIKKEREILGRFVKEAMVKDTDFGLIPGTKSRTLYKPGAEKLADLFRCTPTFEIVKSIEDFDGGLFYFVMMCRMVQRDSGVVIAEGLGSCSSRESKYRYREGQRVCPSCHGPFIMKGSEQYGGGWYCASKKGGCGLKFVDRAPEIFGQQMARTENPDVADQANTILKMATKRALIAGVLPISRCSDLFNAESEDQVEVVNETTGEVVTTGSTEAFSQRISAAATMVELVAVGDEIKKLGAAAQGKLKQPFAKKRAAIAAAEKASDFGADELAAGTAAAGGVA